MDCQFTISLTVRLSKMIKLQGTNKKIIIIIKDSQDLIIHFTAVNCFNHAAITEEHLLREFY